METADVFMLRVCERVFQAGNTSTRQKSYLS